MTITDDRNIYKPLLLCCGRKETATFIVRNFLCVRFVSVSFFLVPNVALSEEDEATRAVATFRVRYTFVIRSPVVFLLVLGRNRRKKDGERTLRLT